MTELDLSHTVLEMKTKFLPTDMQTHFYLSLSYLLQPTYCIAKCSSTSLTSYSPKVTNQTFKTVFQNNKILM